MKHIRILYFSGTGNTEYVARAIYRSLIERGMEKNLIKIKNIEHFGSEQEECYEVQSFMNFCNLAIVCYPIYGSMLPGIVESFLQKYQEAFRGKHIIGVATQSAYSGDGGILAYRKLKKLKVQCINSGGEHFIMPNNICDTKVFGKIDEDDKVVECAKKAQNKVDLFTAKLVQNGKVYRRGSNIFSRMLGAFQRIPFSFVTKKLTSGIKIEESRCVKCYRCVNVCPMDNLTVEDKVVKQNDKCTWCYRCINQCPQRVISLLSKENKPSIQYIGVEETLKINAK